MLESERHGAPLLWEFAVEWKHQILWTCWVEMLALIQKSDLVGRGTSDSVCCSCSGIHIAYIAMERTHISFRTTAMSSPVLPLFIFMVHVTCSSKLRAQSPNTRFRFFFFFTSFPKEVGSRSATPRCRWEAIFQSDGPVDKWHQTFRGRICVCWCTK